MSAAMFSFFAVAAVGAVLMGRSSRHAFLARGRESRAGEGWDAGELEGDPFAGDQPVTGRAAELDEDERPVCERHRHT